MKLTKSQYDELVNKYAYETSMGLQKTAAFRRRQKAFKAKPGVIYASGPTVSKLPAPAVAGEVVRKKKLSRGAKAAAGTAALAGAGTLAANAYKSKKAARAAAAKAAAKAKMVKNLKIGGAAAAGTAALGGGAYALSRRGKRDSVKEASELLVDVLLEKQACLQDYQEAGCVMDAAELALNQLGYSMFSK